MTLQILINHYKEDEKKVKTFLKSLNIQKNIEFEALIISDGGDIHLTQEQLNGYSFPIKYAYCSHSGVCHTRNILLNNSNADYIMFCDIDDMFWKPDGLFSLMKAAEETQANVIGSPYQYEQYNSNTQKIEYKVLNRDTLRVHGKIFKRKYLIDNYICFPDEMETSGDMAFLWLAYSLTDKIIWINNNFYIWKWNPNSVTRADKFFTVNTFGNTLKCYELLAENLKQRKRFDIFQNLIPTLFSMIYLEITHPYWKTAPIEMQKKGIQDAKKCLKMYYNDYKNINIEKREKRYNYMLDFLHGKNICGKFEDMLPWIEEMIKEKQQLILIPDCKDIPDGYILTTKNGQPIWRPSV